VLDAQFDAPFVPNLPALRFALAQEQVRQHLTLEQLSERTGLSRTSIWNILNGKHVGKLLSWHSLARALGVPLAHFVDALALQPGSDPTPYSPD
jgi:transcriptional regulator with XRE-family HTH domain